MQAVSRSFEAPPLPRFQRILSHQPIYPMTTDIDPVISKLSRLALSAVSFVLQCKILANIIHQHHVLILSTSIHSILPLKIASLTDSNNLSETLYF